MNNILNTLDGIYGEFASVFPGIDMRYISGIRKRDNIIYKQAIFKSESVRTLCNSISEALDFYIGDLPGGFSPQTISNENKELLYEVNGLKVKYLGYGSESITFLIEIDGVKYVLKTFQNITNNPRAFYEYPLRKDYKKELVLRNLIKQNLGELLSKFNLDLSPIYLATESFCIEPYSEGSQIEDTTLVPEEVINSIYKLLREIEEQEPILGGYEPDVNTEGFIQTTNSLIWVDPLVRFQQVRTWLYK